MEAMRRAEAGAEDEGRALHRDGAWRAIWASRARTIRFYEDKGLITPQRAGSTRVYTARDRARMILILRGKRLGFTLREIKEYLDLYDADVTQREQLRLLLRAVQARIGRLEEQRTALEQALAELTGHRIAGACRAERQGPAPPEGGRAGLDGASASSTRQEEAMKNVVIAGYARSPFTSARKGALARVRPDDWPRR